MDHLYRESGARTYILTIIRRELMLNAFQNNQVIEFSIEQSPKF